MLNKNEDLVLGKLIGLVNGVASDEIDENTKGFILYVLDALKEKNHLEELADELIEKKQELLPNCIVCKSPCGRTNDVSLNAITNIAYKEKKEEDYHKLLSSYKEMEFMDIVKSICRLGY